MPENSLSYFVAGGTLAGSVPCYVERQADTDLLAALLAGEPCYVLDTRQVGKSSLIVHAAAQLRAAARRTAILDLSTFGNAPTQEEWYGKLLADTARALELEDEADTFWEEKARFSSEQRWFLAMRDLILPRLTMPLVVFVDEIDAVRNLPFSTDPFFALIRALCNLRAHEADAGLLTFCLAGVATPSDLIRDPRTTPFNVGRRIELRDFTLEEVRALAPGLCGTPAQRGAQMQRIHHWTEGHPYLTQRFCLAAAEKGRTLTAREVDALCRETFLCRRAQSEEANLQFVRRQVLEDSDAPDLLMRYARLRSGRRVAAESADPLTDRLLLSGLVQVEARRDPPRLTVRNRIYARVFDRHWIRANLPDAERRRQSQAVRLGVLRASLVWCGVAAALLFALARQREVGWQQSHIAGLNRKLRAEEGDLAHRTQQVNNAERRLQVVDADIASQRRKLLRLDTKAQNMQRKNLFEHNRLVQTQRDMARTKRGRQKAFATIHHLQQEAERIREDSEAKRQSALALMGSSLSGQEFEALEHGLRAVAPALRRHAPPTSEALRGLGNAATAGVYRLFRLKHPFRLETSGFSADDRLIAAGGWNRWVYLWDTRTGQQVGKVPALPDAYREPRVWTTEFSPDGKYLVTTGRDGIARVWDASALLHSTPHPVWEVPCAVSGTYDPNRRIVAHFSPSGRYLAVSGAVVEEGKQANYATVWDVPARTRLTTLRHDGEINSLAFNNRSILPDHRTVRQDERYLAVAGGSRTVRIFDFRAGREVYHHADEKSDVRAAAFTRWSDSLYLSFADGRTESRGWNPETGREPGQTEPSYLQHSYDQHAGNVPSLACSDDGFFLACADARDFAVQVWYREYTQCPVYSLRTHVASVNSVRFSHDGSRLVTASSDGAAEVWLLAAPLYAISGGALHGVALSPDGSVLAAPAQEPGNGGGRVFLWEAAGDEGRTPLWSRNACGILNEFGGEMAGPVLHAAFSPDGWRLATAGDKGTVLIWKLKYRTGIDTHNPIPLMGHNTMTKVNCVAFSPDGRLLLSGSDDRTACLWDAQTGKLLHTYPHAPARQVRPLRGLPSPLGRLRAGRQGVPHGLHGRHGTKVYVRRPPGAPDADGRTARMDVAALSPVGLLCAGWSYAPHG